MSESEQINVALCIAGEWTADGEALLEARRELVQLRAEVARLRLTDTEREAVETAMNAYGSDNANPECAAIEATLCGLLERTK